MSPATPPDPVTLYRRIHSVAVETALFQSQRLEVAFDRLSNYGATGRSLEDLARSAEVVEALTQALEAFGDLLDIELERCGV